MKNYTTTNKSPNPTFSITKNKGKLKVYNNSNVYLSDNDEFEIELFNPTTDKILAKIKINGVQISTSGIVIKAGQRIFLERFLDSNNKFKFTSYDVESNNKIVDEAIIFNGLIDVDFYLKEIPYNFGYGTTNTFVNYPNTFTTNFSTNICNTLGNNLTNCLSNIHDGIATNNTKKTGTVEKGSVSNQNFINDTDTYSVFSFYSTSIKILTTENKPIEMSEIRRYCTGCGIRVRQENWKFCPSCGTKI